MKNNKDIENATFEAIYWWNRDESYYHKYFSNLDHIYGDKTLLQFFATKIFDVFLREYSIRRNLSAGYENVDKFIEELFDNQFVKRVKEGETRIIDIVSGRIKQEENSTKRQTRSLLSKVAFLINPTEFSLFDNLAKDSLWEINKESKLSRRSDLDSYSGFIGQVNRMLEENEELLDKQAIILKHFEGTPAHDFFLKNPEAFKRRIADKYLWIRKQNKSLESRKIRNDSYPEFIKIEKRR